METEISESSIVVVSKDQVSGDLIDDEVAILGLKDNVYYGLNAVGGRIWNLIQEPKTVQEVRDILLDEYEVDLETCSTELIALLKDLAERNLIKIKNEALP
ncbi:MAG: PqqD family peptide modification chaperone [Sedimentisphaerales bacterium]